MGTTFLLLQERQYLLWSCTELSTVAQWTLLVSHLVEQGLGAKVSIQGWKRVGPCCLRGRGAGRAWAVAHLHTTACCTSLSCLMGSMSLSLPLREITGLVKGTF